MPELDTYESAAMSELVLAKVWIALFQAAALPPITVRSACAAAHEKDIHQKI